jgi:CspA family cold shock protein
VLERFSGQQQNNYQMKEGTVKFFNEAKGFGFVKETATNQEYFVHVSGLVDKVRENDAITFEVTQGKKGLNAVNVRLVK